MKFQRAKRPIAQTVGALMMKSAVGRFAACNLVLHGSWGFARKASLHPRLYAVAALRGLRQIELLRNLIRASFRLIRTASRGW